MIYTAERIYDGAWAVLVSLGDYPVTVATADTRDEANGLVERIIRALNKHHRPWGGDPGFEALVEQEFIKVGDNVFRMSAIAMVGIERRPVADTCDPEPSDVPACKESVMDAYDIMSAADTATVSGPADDVDPIGDQPSE